MRMENKSGTAEWMIVTPMVAFGLGAGPPSEMARMAILVFPAIPGE